MSEEAFELAIVGGGIIGCVAAHLADEAYPDWRLALLDRGPIGGRATGRSAGFDLPYGETPERRAFSALGRRLWREIERDLPGLATDVETFAWVEAGAVEATLAGFVDGNPHVATPAEERALMRALPELAAGQRRGLVLLAGCGGRAAVPQRAARALADRLRDARPGFCREGVEVAAITAITGGFALTCGDGQHLEAERVLVATGPWLPELSGLAPHATALPATLRRKKVAALHLDRRPPPGAPALCFFGEDAFLLPLPERSEWLLSFRADEWDCPADPARLHLSAADRSRALSTLERHAPRLATAAAGGRAFCDLYGPERTPCSAAVDASGTLVVAGAGSGSGYRMAPAIAASALERFPGFASVPRSIAGGGGRSSA